MNNFFFYETITVHMNSKVGRWSADFTIFCSQFADSLFLSLFLVGNADVAAGTVLVHTLTLAVRVVPRLFISLDWPEILQLVVSDDSLPMEQVFNIR